MADFDDEREVTCETCGGEGVVSYDVPDRRGEHTTREEDCPDCGGRGEIEADEEIRDEARTERVLRKLDETDGRFGRDVD